MQRGELGRSSVDAEAPRRPSPELASSSPALPTDGRVAPLGTGARRAPRRTGSGGGSHGVPTDRSTVAASDAPAAERCDSAQPVEGVGRAGRSRPCARRLGHRLASFGGPSAADPSATNCGEASARRARRGGRRTSDVAAVVALLDHLAGAVERRERRRPARRARRARRSGPSTGSASADRGEQLRRRPRRSARSRPPSPGWRRRGASRCVGGEIGLVEGEQLGDARRPRSLRAPSRTASICPSGSAARRVDDVDEQVRRRRRPRASSGTPRRAGGAACGRSRRCPSRAPSRRRAARGAGSAGRGWRRAGSRRARRRR